MAEWGGRKMARPRGGGKEDSGEYGTVPDETRERKLCFGIIDGEEANGAVGTKATRQPRWL